MRVHLLLTNGYSYPAVEYDIRCRNTLRISETSPCSNVSSPDHRGGKLLEPFLCRVPLLAQNRTVTLALFEAQICPVSISRAQKPTSADDAARSRRSSLSRKAWSEYLPGQGIGKYLCNKLEPFDNHLRPQPFFSDCVKT